MLFVLHPKRGKLYPKINNPFMAYRRATAGGGRGEIFQMLLLKFYWKTFLSVNCPNSPNRQACRVTSQLFRVVSSQFELHLKE